MNYLYGFCPHGPNCKDEHVKMFFPLDKEFYDYWKSKNISTNNFRVIQCNKCKELGHKANKCNIEEVFPTRANKREMDQNSSNNNMYNPVKKIKTD